MNKKEECTFKRIVKPFI